MASAGRIDAIVEAFEQRVQENPHSADARVDLGAAYIQKMFTLPDGPARAAIGQRIDQAFTEALEVDPSHWRARFKKAVGLSYWPDVSGKQTEAVRHFEILLEQQSSSASQSGFAQTYLFLGSLYERRGDAAKAREMWQRGLSAHPDDSALRQRLAR